MASELASGSRYSRISTIGRPGGRVGASHRGHWVQPGVLAEGQGRSHQSRSETVGPYRPASREMSLMLAIPYPKRFRTGFEKAE